MNIYSIRQEKTGGPIETQIKEVDVVENFIISMKLLSDSVRCLNNGCVYNTKETILVEF